MNMSANMTVENGPRDEEYISKRELARRLQMPQRTIEYYMRRGWFPHYKIGQSVRFRWNEIRAYLDTKCRVG